MLVYKLVVAVVLLVSTCFEAMIFLSALQFMVYVEYFVEHFPVTFVNCRLVGSKNYNSFWPP